MKKTGLKTFAISFLLTLSVIFSVNGLTVRDRKPLPKKYIPQKNISLFFEQKSDANFASSAPVKKVALSVLAEADIPPPMADKAEAKKIEPGPSRLEAPQIIADNHYVKNPSQPPQGKEEPKNIIVADNTIKPAPEPKPEKDKKTEEKEESAFIPLEKGNGAAMSNTKMQIASSANEKTNQVAMSEGNANVKNMAVDSAFDDPAELAQTTPDWKTMKEAKPDAGSPWQEAKGPDNTVFSNTDLNASSGSQKAGKAEETLASADMVKNILIPIPKDIAAQDPLVPQLVVEDPKVGVSNDTAPQKIEKSAEKDSKGFLSGLKNIFSNSDKAKTTLQPSEFDGADDELYDKLKKNQSEAANSAAAAKQPVKILPTEMKLSFQPNRAEISGQTLKWIQAFVNKVNEEKGLILEVRVDGNSSQELQSKRLNLLNEILVNKGLDLRKVNTIITNREPNSFVIRAIRVSENSDLLAQKTKEKREIPYYNQGRGTASDSYQQW